jgi:AcrR family transcriptional regulator
MATAPRTAPEITPRGIDPRVKRTRQLIKQAFFDLMREKSYPDISIQDIAERATVNRGTFYAHFADKSALLDTVIREEFRQAVEQRLPAQLPWGKATLRVLVETAMGFFKALDEHCSPAHGMDPLIERAAQEELAGLLVEWLRRAPATGARWKVPIETVALVVSWAIFGSAAQWGQGRTAISQERMTSDVVTVIAEGLARLAPRALPE